MARPSLTDISKIICSHQRWMTDPSLGSRADFSSMDLSGADLTGVDLQKAFFRRANLSGANLSDAKLCASDLSMSNLDGANLSRAILTGAVVRSASLERTVLEGSILECADMSNSCFLMARLDGIRANSSMLRGASISCMSASGVDFSYADMENVKASCFVVRRSSFSRARMTRLSMRNSVIHQSSLYRVSLLNAQIDESCITECDMRLSSWNRAQLHNTCLDGSLLSGCSRLAYDCFPSGNFVAYKKVLPANLPHDLDPEDMRRAAAVISIEIPGSARRTAVAGFDSGRADRVFVHGTEDSSCGNEFCSIYDPSFIYRVGSYAIEPNYDGDPLVLWTRGISFFPRKDQATSHDPCDSHMRRKP